MTSSLYRREALQNATKPIEGQIILTSPPGLRLMLGILSAVLITLISLSALVQVKHQERVDGRLIYRGGSADAIVSRAGAVEQILVDEGETVRRGDALFTIATTAQASENSSYEAVSKRLDAQRVAIRDEHESTTRARSSQAIDLRDQIAGLNGRLAQLELRLSLARRRHDISSIRSARLEAVVAQQLISQAEHESVKLAVLDAESEIATASMAVSELLDKRAALSSSLALLAGEAEVEEARLNSALAKLDLDAEEKLGLLRYTVLASRDGTVGSILRDVGDSVAQGDTVATIHSGGTELQAELFAPSEAAPFMKVGQEVRLAYAGFPRERFGFGLGHVVYVSSSEFADRRDTQSTGQTTYRLIVKIDEPFVSSNVAPPRLSAGTKVAADIVYERRSIASWLIQRLRISKKELS